MGSNKTKKVKNNKKVKKNKNNKKNKSMPRKSATSNKVKVVNNTTINAEKTNDETNMDKPYEYILDNVHWKFDGEQRSSTIIYIGNIPNYIKIGAVQFFVMKKAKVTMKQIEETILKQGSRGQFALVRFRSDVSIDRIIKFMNDTNTENTKIAEERKTEKKKNNK